MYAFEKGGRGWGYDKPNSVCLIKSNMFYVDTIRPVYDVLLILAYLLKGGQGRKVAEDQEDPEWYLKGVHRPDVRD